MRVMVILGLLSLIANISGCQHYCENYIDCDASIRSLQKKVASLETENRRLRVTAMDMAYERCDIR